MKKEFLTSPEEIYSFWRQNGYFKHNPSSAKPAFSLLMPPPNLTGEMHMGHALQHVILDGLARFKRLDGYEVFLLPGVDHAGIQFEGTLNKHLEKRGLSKEKLGREEWLKEAWKFKDEVYKSFQKTWSVFGLSADWEKEVFSLEEKVRNAVFAQFKAFWQEGLLYKGAYIVQWCPKCQTAIEDVEMEYENRRDTLYYLKYGPLTIATTRPETKFADTAVAVNPHDKRYKQYVGKEIVVEALLGPRKMKVIADEAIDPDFGTGAEKVTPGHDILDYEIGKRHNLPVIQIIGKDGRLTKEAGVYAGMKVAKAREAIVPALREKGILVKEEEYIHSVPVCERCKTVVEPIISEEWFVQMKPLAQKALEKTAEIRFVPTNYQQIIAKWLTEIHDWSISRSLWWGHRIPVWYCLSCNKGKKVGKDKGMMLSLQKPNTKCPLCQKENWVQDEQVLDTWFSSGMWPLSTLGWPKETEDLKRYYPWGFEITAPEIKFLWIGRMIMLGVWFRGEIPFRNMFFHGTIRDLKGRKMSKSLGNGIDPLELVEKWGVDAVRMALYTLAAPGRDPKVSRQVLDERCKNFRNFITKLRNIAHFVIDLKPEEKTQEKMAFHADDTEILQKMEEATSKIKTYFANFQFHLASLEIYNFIWHEFADSYLEKSKKRRSAAQPVLEKVFKESLIFLHPFMPFTTEELYQKLPEKKTSIMLEELAQKG